MIVAWALARAAWFWNGKAAKRMMTILIIQDAAG